ncbi:MAG: PEGA domain-containing protein [Opitutales bacterium]
MNYSLIPFLVAVAGVAFLSGCGSSGGVAGQEVNIISTPSGADVFINNEPAGQTPLTVSLDKTASHQVEVTKRFFEPTRSIIAPSGSGEGPFLRFGLLEEFGYYNQLAPDPLEVSLRSDILPAAKAFDSFEEFAYLTTLVDQLLEEGEISPSEHKYISRQLIEFYTR